MNRYFVTGDKHGDFSSIYDFIDRMDFNYEEINILILGDCGLFWRDDKRDAEFKIKFHELNYKFHIYFIDGNHENFNILNSLSNNENKIIDISNHIHYIKRGTILDLPIGKCLFLGGADSVDKIFRKKDIDWWENERITDKDIENIPAGKYDYLFTHCTNYNTCKNFRHLLYTIEVKENEENHISEKKLDELNKKITYNKNFFGHYHINKELDKNHYCLYNDIIELEVKK